MKIDKSRFLALTGVLAAASGIGAVSACTLTTVTGNEPDGSTTTPVLDSGTESDGATTSDAATSDATSDAPTTDAADGAACLGPDKVQNPPCSSFVDAGTSCAGSEGGQFYCSQVEDKYTNGVARSIMQCLSLAPTCEAVPDPIARCTFAALDQACLDSAAATPCMQAAQACAGNGITPTIDQAKCQKYFSGLSATGRTEFTSCAVEGCALVENSGCF